MIQVGDEGNGKKKMQVAFQTISLFLLQDSMHKMPSLTPHLLILLCGSEFQIHFVFNFVPPAGPQNHKNKLSQNLCECHLQNTLRIVYIPPKRTCSSLLVWAA